MIGYGAITNIVSAVGYPSITKNYTDGDNLEGIFTHSIELCPWLFNFCHTNTFARHIMDEMVGFVAMPAAT